MVILQREDEADYDIRTALVSLGISNVRITLAAVYETVIVVLESITQLLVKFSPIVNVRLRQ